jgi:mono/diheme cytochrome c family protein
MYYIWNHNSVFGILIALFVVIAFSISATFTQQPVNWTAPKSADTLKNPFINNADATAKGMTLFTKMCVVCHGSKGKGDGIAGVNLHPRPENLTAAYIQKQSDGAIFWKITNGKPPMASYKKPLTATQRWTLVNYIRELGKSNLKYGKT